MENKLEEFPFKHNKLFIAENYLKAVGVIHTIKSGIKLDTVKRPIQYTNILNAKYDDNQVATSESFVSNAKRQNKNTLTQAYPLISCLVNCLFSQHPPALSSTSSI
jgi:hypothetical protein